MSWNPPFYLGSGFTTGLEKRKNSRCEKLRREAGMGTQLSAIQPLIFHIFHISLFFKTSLMHTAIYSFMLKMHTLIYTYTCFRSSQYKPKTLCIKIHIINAHLQWWFKNRSSGWLPVRMDSVDVPYHLSCIIHKCLTCQKTSFNVSWWKLIKCSQSFPSSHL